MRRFIPLFCLALSVTVKAHASPYDYAYGSMAYHNERSREDSFNRYMSSGTSMGSSNVDFSGVIAQFKKAWPDRKSARDVPYRSYAEMEADRLDRQYRPFLSYNPAYSSPSPAPRVAPHVETAAEKEARWQEELKRAHQHLIELDPKYLVEDGNDAARAEKWAEAAALYHRAGERGSIAGLWGEVRLYLSGSMGTDWSANYHKALPLLDQLIARGDAGAMGQAAALCLFMDGRQDGGQTLDLTAEVVRYAQMGAQKGDVWSMGEMALRLSQGRGVPQDEKAAVTWLLKALEADNSAAQYALGLRTRGINVETALRFFEVVADRRFTVKANTAAFAVTLQAARDAGAILIHSRDESQRVKGRDYLEYGHKNGEVGALYPLGVAYDQGLGTARDEAKAIALFQQGVDALDKDCLLEMGYRTREGRGVAKDENASRFDFLAAAVVGKSGEAMAQVALIYDPKTEGAGRLRWLEKAAVAGWDEAKLDLANALRDGSLGRQDFAKAREWLFDASLEGYYPAAQTLAKWAHEGGDGLEKNDPYAKLVLEAAANCAGSDPKIWKATAHQFAQGDGAPRDLDAAQKWYQKAADSGDAEAAKMLQTVKLMKMVG